MHVINDWDESLYRSIARASASKQAVVDVSYARAQFFRNQHNQIHLRDDERGMILGNYTGVSCRIIVVAVDTKFQGQGIGAELVRTVEVIAGRHGCKRVYTVTNEGKTFYERLSYQPIERRKNGWVMEKKIK